MVIMAEGYSKFHALSISDAWFVATAAAATSESRNSWTPLDANIFGWNIAIGSR